MHIELSFGPARDQIRFCFIERVMRSQLLSEISRSGQRRWLQVDEMPFSSAPNHYMAVSVNGASRGSGATVTLDGSELRGNGRNPLATRVTKNGAEILAPVTCPKPPLKGGRRGASGGSWDEV